MTDFAGGRFGRGIRRTLLVAALSAGFAGPAMAETRPAPRSFIVTCQCKTSAERQRIAAEVRKRGGEVLYIYNEIHGLAVAAPQGTGAKRFAASLQRIRGVIAVQPDSVSQPSSVN